MLQFGERVDHGGWLIGPKLFCPKASKALRIYFSWWLFKEVVLAKALTDGTGSLPLRSGWSRRREVIGAAAGRREWWHEEQTVVNVVKI